MATGHREPVDGGQPARTRRPSARRLFGGVLTLLAATLVFVALVVPDQLGRAKPGDFVPGAFLRIPLEGLVGAAILLAAPARGRRIVAALLGLGLGVLTILKILNIGFLAVLARRFDPVLDWSLLDDGHNFVTESFGPAVGTGAAIGAVLLAVALPVLTMAAVLRLTRLTIRHRVPATRTVTALVAAWAVVALAGTHLFPGAPVAADSTVRLARDTAVNVPFSLQDRQRFTAEASVDAFRNTPSSELLNALRGKDVIFSFVESYGRSALDDPQQAALLEPALATGAQQLTAAGYKAKSAYLTSSTYGGSSWLAHASFHSGLWINNQQRYRQLVSGDRLTIPNAFKRANWWTVGIEPGSTRAWPEAKFYGYDDVYDSRNLGYRGPKFGWSSMPDQYALAAFQRNVYSQPGRRPLMAEISLTSSHTPWAPTPKLIDWADVGDGAVYGPIAQNAPQRSEVWQIASRVRAEYARSVAYSVGSLLSWAATYGNENLVLVFLGDHQASPIVSGQDATHDVPITIVAHDPAVFDRIAGWGWTDGLKPGPQAPVWKMDTFRDRFLSAF